MNGSSSRLTRRLGAALGAVAIGAAGMIGLSTAAYAAPSDLSFGNIDEDASGSIIIHKHEHQSETSIEADAQGNVDIPTDGVADVEFTVYELLYNGAAVDLTDPAAWNSLSDVVVGDSCEITAPAGYSVGNVVTTATTDANGQATVDVDSIGAYVVCETDAPAHVTDRAAPFVVTIPFPYDNGWIYDVNVYPKNGVTAIEKTIVPQDPNGLGLGSVIQFPVTVEIPAIAPDRDFTSFDVVDTLDSRLELTPAGNGVLSVQIDGTDVDPALYNVSVSANTVTVAFDVNNPAAQTLLKDNATNDLVIVFQGTVTELGDGVIENTAELFVNDPDHENGVESNEVWTNWGDIKISKVDSADPSTGLEGAEFQVFEADPAYGQCSTATPTGDPIAVLVDGDVTDTFVSGPDGSVLIPGLFVSDSENDPTDAQERCYVVVETQAPAGFVTPEGADAQFPVAVSIGQTADVYLTVENVQQDVPELPITGAAGQILMIIGGLVLVAVAGGLVVVNRRRAAQQ